MRWSKQTPKPFTIHFHNYPSFERPGTLVTRERNSNNLSHYLSTIKATTTLLFYMEVLSGTHSFHLSSQARQER